MIDILVVSQSCLNSVNRAPYRELARRGWSVEIAVPQRLKQDRFDRAADPRGANDPPIHPLALDGNHPRLLRYEGIGELLERLDPQVVLLDADPGTRQAIDVGRWARRKSRHVACITCENMSRSLLGEFRRSPGAAARFMIARALVKLARPLVHHVFVLSSESAAVVRELGFGDRTTLIPLGFDPAIFKPDPAARDRIRSELALGSVTFAYFGRVMPEKGIHILLAALHGLRDRPWKLMLDEFGEYPTPYAAELRGLIKELDLAQRVVFFDASHAEVARYMNAADVVVLPSITTPTFKEQYGRVIPEAMACGRLVVVSDCGALPEVAGPPGVVVKQNDESSLREALLRILDDPEVVARGSLSAVDYATANHSLSVQCSRMEAVFRSWVTAPAAPSAAL